MRTITTLLLGVALMTMLSIVLRNQHSEAVRLRANNEALTTEMLIYRNKHNKSVASVAELRLTLSELRKQHSDAIAEIRNLNIKLRRVERYAHSVTATIIRDTLIITALPPRDTQSHHTSPHDTSPTRHEIRYTDTWTELRGEIWGDSLSLELRSVDTLHQVIHRIPRRFLRIPFGTKYLRQEVWSSNPHTELVYTETIKIGKK